MTEAEMRTAVSIIRELFDDALNEEIDAEICRELGPRITPKDLAAAWSQWGDAAELEARRGNVEFKLFKAWASEQAARGRPESELTFGTFARENEPCEENQADRDRLLKLYGDVLEV
jgi:hypothetical protein